MYLIITERTIHHEGDERSRSHPGHGYPAYSEEVSVVEYIENRETFEARVMQLENGTYSRQKYKAFKADPVVVSKKIEINIGN